MATQTEPRVPALQKVRTFISSYGPAIFIIGALIGTGSVSSLVLAGADHGMSLLWALLLSCVFFWVLIASISRLTIVSGKTFVSLAREHFGTAGALYVMLAIVIGQFTSNIGVLGIVSEAFASWLSLDFLWTALFWSTLVYVLIVTGKFPVFERLLIFFTTVLALSFIANMFMARPAAGIIVQGLIPSVPEGGAILVGAMVGTTLAASVVIMRSYVVYDKGWTLNELAHADKDAKVTGALVFIISGVIMACAAATLHVQGIRVESAIDMAYTLVPLMGRFAATLFVVGIVAAGVSSAFTNALVSSWCVADFFSLSRDPRSTPFRLIALPFCAAGIIAPLFGGRPVPLTIMSLAIQALFLPLLVVFLMILLNKEAVAGRHTNTRAVNVLSIITLVFSLFMAYQAFVGLLNLMQGV